MSDTDEWGRVPLHYAALEKPIDEVRRLLDSTADVDPVDNEGWTPMLFAARGGRTDVVRVLLDAGARVDALTDKGHTALYWAILSNHGDQIGTIRLLRQRGADPAAKTMKSYFGLRSPLDYLRSVDSTPELRAEFADLL